MPSAKRAVRCVSSRAGTCPADILPMAVKAEATTDEILAAVRAVHGEALLLTSDSGLGATVEEEGRNLTAAQRQLIALARAILVEPDILILDEATSSLDADLEDAVLASVTALGRTTIFVTHRLPVAQHSDQVALVDRGRVVEHGTHEGLMAAGGAYAALWSLGTDLDDLAVQR